MTAPISPRLSRGWSGRWWVVAAVLLPILAVAIAAGLRGQQPASASVVAPQFGSAPPATAASIPPEPTVVPDPVVTRSAPVTIRIPAIELTARVSGLGLKSDGTVQVPANPAQTGWYRRGPAPGEEGSAVILGHVDSLQGPAVFYRLRFLRTGDRIQVTLADGAVAHFVVRTVSMYRNEKFPARRVYGSPGYSALQLVTCGGRFDTASGYQSNVVVYSSLVSTTPAPRS